MVVKFASKDGELVPDLHVTEEPSTLPMIGIHTTDAALLAIVERTRSLSPRPGEVAEIASIHNSSGGTLKADDDPAKEVKQGNIIGQAVPIFLLLLKQNGYEIKEALYEYPEFKQMQITLVEGETPYTCQLTPQGMVVTAQKESSVHDLALQASTVSADVKVDGDHITITAAEDFNAICQNPQLKGLMDMAPSRQQAKTTLDTQARTTHISTAPYSEPDNTDKTPLVPSESTTSTAQSKKRGPTL